MRANPKVNVANIERLIEAIEEAGTFDMIEYQSCGAPMCIIGHANALAGSDKLHDSESAAEWMGIDVLETESIALGLNEGGVLYKPLSAITKADAIAMLRNLQVTGKVEWPG